jgi:hypothetical protein
LKASISFTSWLITEAIIDWQGHGVEEFLERINDPGIGGLRFEELRSMATPYGIEVVNYDQFIREIPEENRESAPPRMAPFFALVNPDTERPRIVVNVPMLFARERREISKMLKHELIHVGQLQRRPEGMALGGDDIRDETEYLSNKDEVMAFSHSVVDDLISMGATSVDAGVKLLPRSRMWQWISDKATDSALKRYRKYVYLYLKLELEEEVD